jgi:hypothetical protein
MLPMEKSVTFTGTCENEIIPSINRSFVYKVKEGRHTRIAHIYILYPGCTLRHNQNRNKSWKPECVLSFNMDWLILV